MLAVVAFAAVSGGCDATTTSAAFDEGTTTPSGGDPNLGQAAPFAVGDDASTGMPETFRGSSLCKVKETTCVPDNDGYHNATGGDACSVPPDAPTTDAGGTTAVVKSCRLVKDPKTGAYAPKCDGAGAAGDGATCTTGSECSAGFDCVATAAASVCRRYCCLGSCGSQGSQSGGSTFCDVQKLTAGNKAPVCMPLKHCSLLGTGECDATETCAVVNEAGDSGCVANGDAQVNADCDQAHCASGLSCLGQSGNRKCYQLCKVEGSTCSGDQVCKTSALFKDQTVGICQSP